ncbi:MAG: dockerin type I repeat-containing protein [Muribaculaceae bacterium]|nr:dockerin type I repeat-containing protein [Muribaculaceae bacterium]
MSHVIKDGKIIYKGMRYNPALFNNPGDVNGDGEVNIDDANSVIDIVVMGGNSGHTRIPEADVNGDGEINIADVNAIIEMIINNNQNAIQ